MAHYREDLKGGTLWKMGRLLMITITKSARLAKGTVSESKDGTRFIVRSVPERQEADVHAMAAGPEPTSPQCSTAYWSQPDTE